jgi:murein DD-endopeptidase MepM/ murein hydrolase activator NlpD
MNILWWIIRKSKTELKIVFATLAILLLLPAISLVVLASSGLAIIGEALAAVNPITHLVEIFDPNGNKIQELELSTTWPTTGYVSDEFGTLGELRIELGLGAHTGIDIANERGEAGTPVTPFMKGRVLFVDDIDNSACGKSVKVDHGFGITSIYCHLLSTATLPKADVKPGDIIGYMGSTGTSTGAHTHFQTMVHDIPVNPRIFMVGEPTGTYATPTY